jgi:hypothetical protein
MHCEKKSDFVIIKYVYHLSFPYMFVNSENIHMHMRGGVWALKTNLTLPLFIEVPVPSHESERYVHVY